MRWTISFIAKSNIIQVKTLGNPTFEDAKQLVKDLKEANDTYNSMLFLMDHRKLNLNLPFIIRYHLHEVWKNLGTAKQCQLAEVVSEKHLKDFKHFEIPSNNRWYSMEVFTDINSAKDWLMEKDTST